MRSLEGALIQYDWYTYGGSGHDSPGEDNVKTQRETTTQDWGTEVVHLETKKYQLP